MLIEFQPLMQSLKRREFAPVYFLSGEEPYFIDEVSNYIENHALSEVERDFNQTVLYGKDVDMLTVLAQAKRYPMMSEYQVVIVKEAQNMRELSNDNDVDETDEVEGAKKGGTGKKKSKSTHPLLNYVLDPQKQTILVFCYKYKKLDKRSSFSKELYKYAQVLEADKVRDYNLSKWIVEYGQSIQYSISSQSANLIADFVGNDLSRIVNEINKLIITLQKGTEIKPEHVLNNLGFSKDYNVLELGNALLSRDVLKTNKIVQYFIKNPKEHPNVLTIGYLNNFFNKLLALHFLGKFATHDRKGIHASGSILHSFKD